MEYVVHEERKKEDMYATLGENSLLLMNLPINANEG
jgi:hypothetical protein